MESVKGMMALRWVQIIVETGFQVRSVGGRHWWCYDFHAFEVPLCLWCAFFVHDGTWELCRCSYKASLLDTICCIKL